MLRVISENRYIFALWLIIIFACAGFLFAHGKADSHLIINSFHNQVLDFLMPCITWIGDGMIILTIAILLLFYKIRFSFMFLSSFIATSLMVQLLKRLFFADFPRPVKFFEGSTHSLHLVDGIKYHSWLSFPSGHSATSFALLIGIALIVKNRVLKFACLLMACIGAYSRVYLSQHFLIDIIAGSIIGVIFSVFFYYLFSGMHRKWLDLPLYKFMKAK